MSCYLFLTFLQSIGLLTLYDLRHSQSTEYRNKYSAISILLKKLIDR